MSKPAARATTRVGLRCAANVVAASVDFDLQGLVRTLAGTNGPGIAAVFRW
jgi:hypothetical protein